MTDDDTGTVHRFPTSGWLRTKNRRGKRSVSCIVSGRYFVFGKVDRPMMEGSPIFVDVMTEADPDTKPRKLCSLCVTLEDLKAMVEMLESERDDAH